MKPRLAVAVVRVAVAVAVAIAWLTVHASVARAADAEAPAAVDAPATQQTVTPVSVPGAAAPSSPLPSTGDEHADEDLVGAAGKDDPSFGPLVTIERIDIVGSGHTSPELIRQALLVTEGDKLRAGDSRFRRSRFRVLALGFFHEAELRLEKGSARGLVILTVEVWERGSVVLDAVHLGSSKLTPIWAGLDLGDTNFLGTATTVSGAVVWAAAPDVVGGRPQLGARLRWGDASVGGSPFGISAVAIGTRASETVLVAHGVAPLAYDYERAGGVVGGTWDFLDNYTLSLETRVERLHAGIAIPGELAAGTYWLASGAVGLARDTRSDPIMPAHGTLAFAHAELGGMDGAGEGFARLEARWQGFRALDGHDDHVLALTVGGATTLGAPAGFDRVWLADVDRLATARPLDLTVSTAGALDMLGHADSLIQSGEVGGVLELEYRYRWFRGGGRIYGGDLFIGAGVFALHAEARAGRPAGTAVDLTFDVGVRLDTEVGVFELSLANALGRLPL